MGKFILSARLDIVIEISPVVIAMRKIGTGEEVQSQASTWICKREYLSLMT